VSRVLLLVDQRENRRLLTGFLEGSHELVLPAEGDALAVPFDLGIVDGLALHRLSERIVARRRTEFPFFLPFLLVTSRRNARLATGGLWQAVDELLIAPVEKVELAARLRVLLRARRLSLALEGIEDYAVVLLDPGGTVASWNAGAERVAGRTRDEAAGTSLGELFPDGVGGELLAATSDQGRLSRECWLARGDGARVWTSVSLTALRDEAGRLQGFVAVIADLTERRQLEEQLLQAQKMEALGRLAGGVAHDFNNLLTAITGYTDLLVARGLSDERVLHDVLEIGRAAQRAAGLVRQLLLFSRRQTVEPELLDLDAVVGETRSMLGRLVGADVELVTVLHGRLPRVLADRGQLEQVIVNLVVNARDAMPGGGTLTIATAAEEGAQGQRVLLRVRRKFSG
jgi:PAS domain S-box-containing protein